MGCVYCAICVETKNMYIGYTSRTMEERKADHKKMINGIERNKFYNAIRKYGWDSFEWIKILYSNDIQKLKEWEIKLIEQFDTYHNGLNSTPGGEGVKDWKPTEEQKEHLRQINLGNTYAKGYKWTNEEKEKLSKSKTGKTLSEEHKQHISQSNIGRIVSESTISKIKETRLNNGGYIVSDEQKEKIRQSKLGQKHSEETIQKMKEKSKLYWTEERKQEAREKELLRLFNGGKQRGKDTIKRGVKNIW